jgi:hypothetical protein
MRDKKDPSEQDIGWGKIVKINLQFAFATLILFYGWLCWQGVSWKWWGMWFIAMICFAGGAIQFFLGLKEAWTFYSNLRRWRWFQKLGVRPRADHMAQDSDFEDGGPAR